MFKFITAPNLNWGYCYILMKLLSGRISFFLSFQHKGRLNYMCLQWTISTSTVLYQCILANWLSFISCSVQKKKKNEDWRCFEPLLKRSIAAFTRKIVMVMNWSNDMIKKKITSQVIPSGLMIFYRGKVFYLYIYLFDTRHFADV